MELSLPTSDQIQAMPSQERLTFIMDCRRKVAQKEEISDDTLKLAVEALRLERATSSGGKAGSKSKAPAKQYNEDDL